jgi:hypothetical protein
MTKDEALLKAAAALEVMQNELKKNTIKLASFHKREQCEKLAAKMISKGMLSDSIVSFQEKIAQLMKEEDLKTWEKAIDINLGGLDLGEDDDREKTASATGLNQIMALIMDES